MKINGIIDLTPTMVGAVPNGNLKNVIVDKGTSFPTGTSIPQAGQIFYYTGTSSASYPAPSLYAYDGSAWKQAGGPMLTASIDYYIDPAGSDTTGDGSSGNPFKTVQHALDITPKNLNTYDLTIWLNDGTYAPFTAESFYGGYVTFYSSSDDPELVTITTGPNSVNVEHCSAFIYFYALSFQCITNGATGLILTGSSAVYCFNCLFGDDGIATGTYGVMNWLSILSMDDCFDIDANKVTTGIISYGNTQVRDVTNFGDTFALPISSTVFICL